MVYIVDRTVWPLSLPIRTTLANVVLITTLLHPFLTQTACGLCAHSSSSHVLCAPPTQPEVATTSMPKTFLSTWSSSVPLRIFSCEQLELWSQMELESCMNRRLSPLSMLAGWKTFLGGCHSFLAVIWYFTFHIILLGTIDFIHSFFRRWLERSQCNHWRCRTLSSPTRSTGSRTTRLCLP